MCRRMDFRRHPRYDSFHSLIIRLASNLSLPQDSQQSSWVDEPGIYGMSGGI